MCSFTNLISEELVDHHGDQNDDADNHEDDQHAQTHIFQIGQKVGGLEVHLRAGLGGSCQSIQKMEQFHSSSLPSVMRRRSSE